MQEEMIQMVDDDEIENVGIMSGFMDELEELISEIDAEDLEKNKGGDEADTAKLMGRTPNSPEILMNNLRGDMRSVDARREELADLVGMREAQETPEGVLTLLQSVLAQQEAVPPMPMAPPMPPQGMPPEMMGGMPPEMMGGMPPMPPQGMAPPQGMGIESVMPNMPGMYRGGPVQNFNRGSGQMGVTPASDAFAAYPSDVVEEAKRRVRHMVDGGMVQKYNRGGVVQHFQDGSTPPLGVESVGSYAPALRQPAVDYLTALMGREGAVVPSLQTAMADEAALYETLGLGTDKSASQAQMLFDIGQAAFGYAGNVGADGRPMQGSAAARLSQSLGPLSGKIGAQAGQMSKEGQALKMMALKGAQDKIDATKAANAALSKQQGDLAIKMAETPKLSSFGEKLAVLTANGNMTQEEALATLFPGKGPTVFSEKYDILVAQGIAAGKTPGQAAIDATDRLLPKPGDDLSDRKQEIQDVMRVFRINEEEAMTVLLTQRYSDPITGSQFKFDPILGTASIIKPDYGEGSGERFYSMPGTSIEMLNPEIGEGTGGLAWAKSTFNAWAGQLGFDRFEDVDGNVQKLRFLQNSIVSAMAKDDRVPLLQQQRILSLVPDPLNIPTNPAVARDDLALLVDLLGNQYVADKRMLASPETSRGDRQELTQRSAAFEGILAQILQPDAVNYLLDTINGVSDEIKGYESMSGEDLDNIDFSRLSDYQINLVNQVQKYKVADALAEQEATQDPK
jgi:hypothetical protein